MKLQTNSIDTNSHTIRRVTEGGEEFLVAEDIPFGRPQYLDGGYVPADVWKASVEEWEGVKLPIGHPLDANGDTISVKGNRRVQQKAVAGELRNPRHDPEKETVNGDLWVNVSKAQSIGHYGKRVLERLENGEGLEVSSAYSGPEAEPGEYDGEYRHKVKAEIHPDHVALLPDDLGPGVCSREEGCGVMPDAGQSADTPETTAPATPSPGTFGIAANSLAAGMVIDTNSEERVSLVTDGGVVEDHPEDEDDDGEFSTNQQEGDRVRWVDSDGESVRYGIVVQDLDDDDLVLVAVYVQDGNGEAGTAGGETWSNTQNNVRVSPDSLEVIDQFPAEPASVDSVDANADADADANAEDVDRLADRLFRRFEKAFPGLQRNADAEETSDESEVTTRAESRSDDGTDDPTPTDSTMDNEERINELVNNHGFKRDSLAGMGENCLARTHRLATNSADDGGDGDGDGDGESDPEPENDPEGDDADDDDDADPESDPDGDDPDTDNEDRPEEGNGKSAEELAKEAGLDEIESKLNSLEEKVESRDEYISELEEIIQEREEQEQTEHEKLNEQIQSLTDAYGEDTLEGMSKEQKQATISALSGSQTQMPGQQKSLATNGTDFGGLGTAQAHMNTNSSDDEDEVEGTSTGGAFGDVLRNGGDD